MRMSVVSVGLLAIVAMGARGNGGCIGPMGFEERDSSLDGGSPVCPDARCDLDCPGGFEVDARGCALCQCATSPVDPVACWQDDDCAADEVCDTTNYCESPPGCDGDMACPAVCYGRCVPAQPVDGGCAPVTCDLYCESGFKTDPESGCEVCACNEPPSCVCTEEYAPVCGADGVTYSNGCHAACADVEIAHPGECGVDCNIQCFVADPVCGTDGVTYTCGETEAKCHGVEVAHDGACGTCDEDADCSWGQKCFAPRADDAASCVPVEYCLTANDCSGLANPCGGVTENAWSCEDNTCRSACAQ